MISLYAESEWSVKEFMSLASDKYSLIISIKSCTKLTWLMGMLSW